MLLQLRVTVPPDRTDAVRALFEESALATLLLQCALWRRVPGALPAMEHVPRPRR